MTLPVSLTPPPAPRVADRIGPARLLWFSFNGHELDTLRAELAADAHDPAALMDLAVVEQVLGRQAEGLALQDRALATQRLYRSPGCLTAPRLRVLALAAPLDVGGNTPIEFLITDPDVELTTLYVRPGAPLDAPPDHDVAIVIMPGGDEAAGSRAVLAPLIAAWPRPLLNLPERIVETDRAHLFARLAGIAGLDAPATRRLSRGELSGVAQGAVALPDGVAFPMVVRPVGSHAGRGLDCVADETELDLYVALSDAADFFVMRFVDYSGEDGLFRKYRIVFVDGCAFACHMAISDQWKIWYLNANMAESAEKRAEEARFMEDFDADFGRRHAAALTAIAQRIGLDYFAIDCAETKDGRLLVFEADTAMVVHNMDAPDLYPYKGPQMRKIFAAFTAMLDARAAEATPRAQAAG